VLLCSDGTVFSCGRNDSGQLGHGDTVDKKIPHPVTSCPRKISSISCGQFHTVVSTAVGQVYVCGKNDYSQLGIENTSAVKVLTRINIPSEMDNIVQVCCGYYHTLLLSSTGIVGGFGRNDYSQLGLGHSQQKVYICTIVLGLRDKGVNLLAAGCYHSVAATTNGMLYVFGRNNHGQLATGDNDERHSPHPVDDFVGQRILAVSAGFYHTVVLTSDSISTVTPFPAVLKGVSELISTETSSPSSSFCERDFRQLAAEFKKDLEMLCGYESLDNNKAPPLKSAALSFDQLSSISCRELLAVLIRYLSIFDQKELSVVALDNRNAVVSGLQSILSLFFLLWEIVRDSNLFQINLPISVMDAQYLLRRLLPSLSGFLQLNKRTILEMLEEEQSGGSEDDENFIVDSFDEARALNEVSTLSSSVGQILRIRKMVEEIFISSDSMSSPCVTTSRSRALSKNMRRFRIVLLQIYFDSKIVQYSDSNNDGFINIAISDMLLAHHEVFFYHPVSFLSLVKYLRKYLFETDGGLSSLPSTSSMMVGDNRMQSLYLRLLGSVGKVYHNIEETIKTFQKSKKCGLEILQNFLKIYNLYSKYSFERALSSSSSSSNSNLNRGGVDTRRVLIVLEQSINTFLKCGVPLILQCSSRSEAQYGLVNPHRIVLEMLEESENILDITLSQSPLLPDETLTQLRYNTQMPSILPSTFLFCIASAKYSLLQDDHCCWRLFPELLSFMTKLQQLTQHEMHNFQAKSVSEKTRNIDSSASSSTALAKRMSNLSEPSSLGQREEEAVSDAFAEELLYIKKDQNQISWWFRLLKLTLNLVCRISFSTHRVISVAQSSSATLSTVPDLLRNHHLWSHVHISTNYLVEWKDFAITVPPVSQQVIELCFSYREKEKSVDNVYKMLALSTQSSLSGLLLRQMEEICFETCLSYYYPFALSSFPIHPKYHSKIFHLASSLTKFIHGRRSQLVNGSGGTWVEILTKLAMIMFEVSSMLLSHLLSVSRVLPFPRLLALSNREKGCGLGKKRWRTALLTVLAVCRWKKAVKHHYSSDITVLVVDFISNCLSYVTNEFTAISSGPSSVEGENEIARLKIRSLYDILLEENNKHYVISDQLSSAVSLLESVKPLSLKCDIITALMACLRDKKKGSSLVMESVQVCIPSPCSASNNRLLVQAVRSLEEAAMRMIGLPLASPSLFNFTMTELQLLGNAIRLLEILSLSPKISFNGSRDIIADSSFSVAIASKLLLVLFEKYRSWTTIGVGNESDSKHGTGRKLNGNYRERNNVIKRCMFRLLSYLQTFVFVGVERSAKQKCDRSCLDSLFQEVMPAYQSVIGRLQMVRNEEIQMNGEDYPGASCLSVSSFPLLPSTSGHSSSTSKDLNKKKCQDLIIKPLEFSRNSDGIVIQGEKLLNNCKGSDFSITTWILLTAKQSPTSNGVSSINSHNSTANKGTFILGRISHNEAWPMILLKSDGKLEIVYGHNNEYDKAITEASIPSQTWTHLAVVVDQKKIKIFINGVLDTQMTTIKGNSKAIVFPLVIGSCPSNVRTRVSGVKEGFDGMLAQCKYYSRALSPIHIKVIHDHGPPETTDISAKIIYHLLASVKYLLHSSSAVIRANTIVPSALPSHLKTIAELCHLIFMADSNRRNRFAALHLLGNLLQISVSKDVSFVDDLLLTRLQGFSLHSVNSLSSASIFSLNLPHLIVQEEGSALPVSSKHEDRASSLTFQERVVWYFLRIAGANWMQSTLSDTFGQFLATSSSHNEPETCTSLTVSSVLAQKYQKIAEFITFLPRCCFNKNLLEILNISSSMCGGLSKMNSSSSSSANLNNSQFPERICSQEDALGEIAYQVVTILLSLSSEESWRTSIENVLSRVLSDSNELLKCKVVLPQLLLIDLVGCSLFIGGVPNGAYLGANVNNYFNDSFGTIIQINNTVNGATILSSLSQEREVPGEEEVDDNDELIMSGFKTTKVRINDLKFVDDSVTTPSSATKEILVKISSPLLSLLNHLSPFVGLLSRDFISSFIPESSFQMKSLLKCLRPIESFIFMKLMSSVKDIVSLLSTRSIGVPDKPVILDDNLRNVILDFVHCTVPNSEIPTVESIADFPLGNSSTLLANWFSNSKYFISIPEKWISYHFPMESEEAYLFDFMHKQLGLNYDLEIRKEFSTNGLLMNVLFGDYRELLGFKSEKELPQLPAERNLSANQEDSDLVRLSGNNRSDSLSAYSDSYRSQHYISSLIMHHSYHHGSNDNNAFHAALMQQQQQYHHQYLRNRGIATEREKNHTFYMNDIHLKAFHATFDLTLSEKELTNAITYYQHIRKQLMCLSKDLLTSSCLSLSNTKKNDTSDDARSASFFQQCFPASAANPRFVSVMMGTNPSLSAKVTQWISRDQLQFLFSSRSLWNQLNCKMLETSTSLPSDDDKKELSFIYTMKSLISSLKFAATSLLQHRYQKANDNILLTTDLFERLLWNIYQFLEVDSFLSSSKMTSSTSSALFDQMIIIILKELLPIIPSDEAEILEFQILQLIVYSINKYTVKLLKGSCKPNKEILDCIKGISFVEIRTRAQQQLLKFKGHNMSDISHYAYNLIQLVSNLECIQRRSVNIDSHLFLHSLLPKTVTATVTVPLSRTARREGGGAGDASAIAANLSVTKIQSIETASPKLITVRSHSIDLDLSLCLQSVISLATASTSDYLSILSLQPSQVLDNIVVEVALGINSTSGSTNTSGINSTGNSEILYETIFIGSTTRLVQNGLFPDCSYFLKCRVFFGTIPLLWSIPIEFHTEKGLLFTFDSLKCGSDIILSEDNLTASYTNDDTWSSLLANRSFSSGITSWEIRINQSSTAYIFIGVATSQADLNTFLGGCSNGWGFIGEQALYHNREKVKVYGDTFTTGDIVGVTLDLNAGTLSFSKNKKSLGIAFDKLYGDLYPAVAFYNIGQELQIIPDSFKTIAVTSSSSSHSSHSSAASDALPVSLSKLNLDDVSLLNEFILCLASKSSFSYRLATMIAEHCNTWCTSIFVRYRTVSKRDIFLAIESPLLKRFNLVVGEKVRTLYGVAEIAGVAYNRIWFKMNSLGEVWFFTISQILEGRTKKLFMRCTYNIPPASSSASSSTSVEPGNSLSNNNSTKSNVVNENQLNGNATAVGCNTMFMATFDAISILDILDPMKWSKEMDEILMDFLIKQSETHGVEPWKITCDKLFDNFRLLQQQLSRVILSNNHLSHHWGITGPKRKAVIARLGCIRLLNQLLDMYLPFFISDHCSGKFEDYKLPTTVTTSSSSSSIPLPPASSDEFIPMFETFPNIPCSSTFSKADNTPSSSFLTNTIGSSSSSSSLVFSWDMISQKITSIQELYKGLLHSIRYLVFRSIKFLHFHEIMKRTSTKPSKTEDDYDYPENLSHVKINRLKALRAKEGAELLGLNGGDIMLNTMFCQLWKELKNNSLEKLRISYTHPMDDGQSRSFKIKFEGEGVDDYGGPYREIFSQIITELQLLSPSSLASSVTHNYQQGSLEIFNNEDHSSSSSANDVVNHKESEKSALFQTSITSSFFPKDVTSSFPSFFPPHHLSKGGSSSSKPASCFFPLLMPTPNWTNDDSECSEKYRFMFHPNAKSMMKMELYHFMGQLVGIAIRSRITLDLQFPSFIWKSIVGETLTEKDLASFDQSSYNFIEKLKTILEHYENKQQKEQQHHQQQQLASSSTKNLLVMTEEEEKENLIDYEMIRDLTWMVRRSDGKMIELKENGKNKNVELFELKEYLTCYVEYRLEENATSISMFRNGLLTIVPESSISILTWNELQSIVCGSNTIDILRLKENTEYDDDVSSDDIHIIHFWEVLDEFNEIEKSAFLKFVWARPSLPPKDVEFTQKMRILSAASDDNINMKQDQFLPKAHTCFFSINLPKYSSKKVSNHSFFLFYCRFLPFFFLCCIDFGRKTSLCYF
jgi:hypothetical protein